MGVSENSEEVVENAQNVKFVECCVYLLVFHAK